MSHASLIVALSPDEIAEHGDIESAIAFQMEPFNEAGECFEDGTRWDWYGIGGRYTGKFRPDYAPELDPENYKVCWLCAGSGTRMDMLSPWRDGNALYPAKGAGCNGCQATGMALKYPSDFRDVGNICKRGDLTEEVIAAARRVEAARLWSNWEAETHKDEFRQTEIYGLQPGDTLESVTARMESSLIKAYAFLRNRHWHENERLGWFATVVKTECTIKAEAQGIDYQGRCLHTDESTGAKIVTFQEDEQRWGQLYWPRFIRNLPPETTLVVVDYHV